MRASRRTTTSAGPTLITAIGDPARPDAADADRSRFGALFDLSPLGTLVLSPDGVIAAASAAAAELLGRSRAELVGSRTADLAFADDAGQVLGQLRRVATGAAPTVRLEARLVRGDGTVLWTQLDACLLPGDGDAAPLQVLAQLQDISARAERQAELEQVANHDALTGLLNRRGLLEELDLGVARIRRYGRPGALLVIDLDHFKAVNDELGHQAGDVALIAVGALLVGRLRETDAVARHGGDEFAVILPETTQHQATQIAEDLLARIARARVGLPERPITASIGVAMLGRDSTSVSALAAADAAMYDVKRPGGDGVRVAGAA
ncbi:Diguanylate cyclase DgcM [Paraconexibacter sp. AEG42_29]|uniref:Diguanylate cyclase DgcM n=1 Tax=Paraconexibacter sp. AEG42_29 TaxID=2997339 RepID=A0AAU7B0X3_9ACTN